MLHVNLKKTTLFFQDQSFYSTGKKRDYNFKKLINGRILLHRAFQEEDH